ncbi:hypothetical protein, partial [Bacillus atrophaeus]|uniref:hypothetical protein n=1 Tax=Bacillus atrophaeus TaxID=1452 RepID=UPI00227E9F5C
SKVTKRVVFFVLFKINTYSFLLCLSTLNYKIGQVKILPKEKTIAPSGRDHITSLVSGFLGLSWNYKFKANIFSAFLKK